MERTPLRDGIEIKNAASKKIAEFSKVSKTSTKTVKIDGKDVELKVFDDIKGTGSNEAFWAHKPGTSELYYIKLPENIQHAHNEVLASELYKLAGIPSADLKIVEFADKTGKIRKGVASAYLDYERGIVNSHIDSGKNIESFGVDSWLADWDSLTGMNTVVKDGKAIKLDVGGSLRFRAGGEAKGEKFGNEANELFSIYLNKGTSFYKGVAHDDILKSLEKVTNLKDEEIVRIVQEAGKRGLNDPEGMAATLLARKNYIKRFADEMKINPPLPGETKFSFGGYLNRINKKVSSTKVPAPVKCLISDNLIASTNDDQRRVLKDLYENHYAKIVDKKIAFPSMNDKLQEGRILHGSRYSRANFESILKEGLISPDLGKRFREAENGQATIGGLDVFNVSKERTIKQYFEEWLPQKDELCARLSRRDNMRGENAFADLAKGGHGTKKVVFVINPNHPDLKPLMEYRVKSRYLDYDDTPNPEYIGLFTQKAKAGDKTAPVATNRGPNHHWIPVGIPSGYFEKIIVGADITPEQVKEIKELIKKYNLSAKVFNTKGEIL